MDFLRINLKKDVVSFSFRFTRIFEASKLIDDGSVTPTEWQSVIRYVQK